MRFDRLLHLYLLGMALFGVELRPETMQFLRIFGSLVALTGDTFAFAFLIVEAAAVLFRPALDVPEPLLAIE
jgi:hypothetical protein